MKKNVRRFLSCLLVLALALAGMEPKSVSSYAAVRCISSKAVGNETSVDFDLGSIVYHGEAGRETLAQKTTYWGIDKNGVFAFYLLDEKNLPSAKKIINGTKCRYYVQGEKLRSTMTEEAKAAIKYVVGGVNSDVVLEGDGDMANIFSGCTNLLEVFRLPPVSDAECLFKNCTSLRNIYETMVHYDGPSHGNWGHVHNLKGTFYNCVSLRGTLTLPIVVGRSNVYDCGYLHCIADKDTFYNISKDISKDGDVLQVELPFYDDNYSCSLEDVEVDATGWRTAYKSLCKGSYIMAIETSSMPSQDAFYCTLASEHPYSPEKFCGVYKGQTVMSSIIYGQSLSDAADAVYTENGAIGCIYSAGEHAFTNKLTTDKIFVKSNDKISISSEDQPNYVPLAGVYSSAANTGTISIKEENNDAARGGWGFAGRKIIVDKCPLSFCKVTVQDSEKKYTGNPVENLVTITNPYNNEELVEGKDYTITYSPNNIDTGIVTMNITGCGDNYRGTTTATFRIVDVDAPGVDITTNRTNDTTQSVLLKAQDNVGVTSYYFGASKSPSASDFKTVSSQKSFELQKEISEKGTYYFIAKDAAGNTSDVECLKCNAVMLNPDGGEVSIGGSIYKENVLFVKANNTKISLPTPVKKGYGFASWGGYEHEYTVSEDCTLNAVYNELEYDITYILNGGAASNPNKYTVKDAFSLKSPTKEGYVFDGWTGSNGEKPEKDVMIPAGSTNNRTYTAHYTHVYDYDKASKALTVYKVSDDALKVIMGNKDVVNAEKIIFAESVKNIADFSFKKFANLKDIEVKAENADYISVNGLLYSSDKTTLMYCPAAKTEAEIPSDAKEIATGAFADYKEEYFAVPYTVSKINKNAFGNTLHNIVIKNPKAEISTNAFDGTPTIYGFKDSTASDFCDIEKLNFSAITSISKDFFGKVVEKDFTVPDNIEKIEKDAFANAIFEEIDFAGIDTTIADDAAINSETLINCYFNSNAYNYAANNQCKLALKIGYELDKTENFVWPEGTALPNEKLTTIHIGPYLKTISANAFAGCKNLKTVVFDEKSILETIGEKAFSQSGLTEIILPSSVKTIGAGIFEGAESLALADLGSVTIIPDNAFNGCKSLTTLRNTDKWEKLGAYALAGTGIKEFVVGENMKEIGEKAFADSQLEVIEVKNPNCKFPSSKIFPNKTVMKAYEGSTADNYYKKQYGQSSDSYEGKAAYKVPINLMGGILEDEEVVYVVKGKKTPCVSVPTKEGYAFKGYYDAQSDGEQYFDENGKPTKSIWEKDESSNLTLYARWGEKTYTIAYDGNGSNNGIMPNDEIGIGKYVALSQNKYEKSGYTFLGWSKNKNAKAPDYPDCAMVKDLAEQGKTTTLYAVWAKNDTKYTVLTKTQKADGSYEEQEVEKYAPEGVTIQAQEDVDYTVPEGYCLDPDNSALQCFVSGSTTPQLIIVLNRVPAKITFYNGETVVKEQSCSWGAETDINYTLSSSDELDFAGWAKTSTATSDDVITKVTVSAGGVKLYAIWKAKKNVATPKPVKPDPTAAPAPTAVPTTKPIQKTAIQKNNVKKANVSYQISGKGVVVKKVTSKKLKKVTIQKAVTINGKKYKVTAIAKNAFKGCKKLKKITIKAAKLKSIGKNAFKGIYKKATFKVPKKQLKKYKKLIQKKKTGFVETMKVKK